MILWDHKVPYVLWGLCLHNLINCTSLCWWGTPFVSNFWGMPWNFRSSGIRSFRQQWQQQATEGSALCQWGVHGMWMAMDLASELRWRGWKAGGLSTVNGISMGYRPSTGTGGVFLFGTHWPMIPITYRKIQFWHWTHGISQLWHHGFTVLPISSCFGIAKGCWFGIAQVISCYIRVIAIPSTSIHQKVAHRSLFDLDILSCQTGGRYGDTILRAAGPVQFSTAQKNLYIEPKSVPAARTEMWKRSGIFDPLHSCLEVNGVCFKSGLYWFVVDHLNLQWCVPLFLWVWSQDGREIAVAVLFFDERHDPPNTMTKPRRYRGAGGGRRARFGRWRLRLTFVSRDAGAVVVVITARRTIQCIVS